MKRFRLALLLFPILLGALAWGLKWRADNPSSTKEDLAVRALLMRYAEGKVALHQQRSGFAKPLGNISSQEMRPLVTSLYVEKQIALNRVGDEIAICLPYTSKNKNYHESWIYLSVEVSRGVIDINEAGTGGRHYQLSRATAIKWKRFILNHPRIGPELRRRMKP